VFAFIVATLRDGGDLLTRDEAVLRWFVDHRSEATIRVARWVSTLGGFVSLMIVGVLIAFWLWRRGSHIAWAVSPLGALLIAGAVAALAKAFFGRERPPVSVHETTVTLAAFPSGHATDAAAFFLAASFTLSLTVACRRSTQMLLVAAGLFCAALVGISRLVLGVSSPDGHSEARSPSPWSRLCGG
jgi:undecaprenyl-diphosphatase